eukprot:RCo049386
MGKTSTGLLLQHSFLEQEGIFVVFISLPLVGQELCAPDGSGVEMFLENTMGLSKSDFSEAEERSVVVVMDSYDEVLPWVREGVEKVGGLVGLLNAAVGERPLRRVVVSSGPEAAASN